MAELESSQEIKIMVFIFDSIPVSVCHRRIGMQWLIVNSDRMKPHSLFSNIGLDLEVESKV